MKSKPSLMKQILLGLTASSLLSMLAANQLVAFAQEEGATPVASQTMTEPESEATQTGGPEASPGGDQGVGGDQTLDVTAEVPLETTSGVGEDTTGALSDESSPVTSLENPSGETPQDPTTDPATSPGGETATSSQEASGSQEDLASSQASPEVIEDKASQATSQATIELAADQVYMTDAKTITTSIPLSGVDWDNMTWTLNGKPLDQVLTWNLTRGGGGGFSGPQWIQVQGQDQSLTIQIASLFGEDLSQRTAYGNIRREYRNHIGDYVLEGKSADGSQIIRQTFSLKPYEAYESYEEMLASIEEAKNQALSDRLVTIESIGTSSLGNEVKFGVIAKDQASIDHYLHTTTPMMLEHPDEFLALIEAGQADYKLPIMFNNTHADEQPGIDIVASLFRDFATKDKLSFDSQATSNDRYGFWPGSDGKQVVELEIAKLLDRFIFLFNFTENPDGAIANTRALDNGLDPNRDTGYQANPETKIVAEQINKWNPISLMDFHGFVKDFLIEPATPPHDPNFEYDLLEDHLMGNAQSMGNAGIANSSYDHYIIPKVDYGDGWDDAFSGYTAVYALYHGILGHTIEIPATNQESFKAGYFAGLGGVDYAAHHFEDLMKMRLAFYSRGVNKIEDPKANDALVGPDGAVVGRIKGDNPTFFPDYYVIPMGVRDGVDLEAMYDMIQYLGRNGVVVKELTQAAGGYQAGDIVIDMAQAKRGFANHVLYKGADESDWGAMYAELVVNFPAMRGFEADAIYQPDLFKGLLGAVTHRQAPRSQVDWTSPYYKVSNASATAVKAINQALKEGKEVYLTQDGYILSASDFANLLKDYALYGEALKNQVPNGQKMAYKKVYSPGHKTGWVGNFVYNSDAINALKELGFDLVEDIAAADVVIFENGRFEASDLGLKPTIIIGGEALSRLEELGVLVGFDAASFEEYSSHEGLMKAIVNKDSLLASGYKLEDLFYSTSGTWIEGMPSDFTPILRIGSEDFFLAGWWPNHEGLAGKLVAIDGTYGDQPLFIYAGNPNNRMHTKSLYRWMTNAIWRGPVAGLVEVILPPEPENPEVVKPDTDKKPQVDMPAKDQVPAPDKLAHVVPEVKAGLLPKTGVKSDISLEISMVLVAVGGIILVLKRKEISYY